MTRWHPFTLIFAPSCTDSGETWVCLLHTTWWSYICNAMSHFKWRHVPPVTLLLICYFPTHQWASSSGARTWRSMLTVSTATAVSLEQPHPVLFLMTRLVDGFDHLFSSFHLDLFRSSGASLSDPVLWICPLAFPQHLSKIWLNSDLTCPCVHLLAFSRSMVFIYPTEFTNSMWFHLLFPCRPVVPLASYSLYTTSKCEYISAIFHLQSQSLNLLGAFVTPHCTNASIYTAAGAVNVL